MDQTQQDTLQAQVAEDKPETNEPKTKKIAVTEIFGPTIQGEGPMAGTKTMFVRFGGCDYRCTSCDSLHAVIPAAVKKNSRYLTAPEIVDELVKLRQGTGTIWVTLSGGNPCMWDLTELLSLLKEVGLCAAIETQGTLAPEWLTKVQMVVISPKSPGMGEKFEPDKFKNMLQLCWGNNVPVAIKVVIFSAQDFEFALDVEREMNSVNPPYYMSELKYLSLGNPYPPVLTPDNMLADNPILIRIAEKEQIGYGPAHLDSLMDSYRVLLDEFTHDARLQSWRFLPQLHVLAYSNEVGR